VYVLANQKVVKARVSVLKEDEANLIILVEKWEVTPTFFCVINSPADKLERQEYVTL